MEDCGLYLYSWIVDTLTTIPLNIFYIFQLYETNNFTKMFAAIFATLVLSVKALRTIWGLRQLYYFFSWIRRAIDGLRALGVANIVSDSIKSTPEIPSWKLAGNTLVNKTIVDYRVLHGGLCSLNISDGPASVPSRSLPISLFFRCSDFIFKILLFLIFWIPDTIAGLFGFKRPVRYLVQIPDKPGELWLRWSVCFAAQHLQPWMKNFVVPDDPRSLPSFYKLTARERSNQRAKNQLLYVAPE